MHILNSPNLTYIFVSLVTTITIYTYIAPKIFLHLLHICHVVGPLISNIPPSRSSQILSVLFLKIYVCNIYIHTYVYIYIYIYILKPPGEKWGISSISRQRNMVSQIRYVRTNFQELHDMANESHLSHLWCIEPEEQNTTKKTETQCDLTWPAVHSNKHKFPQCTAYRCFLIRN